MSQPPILLSDIIISNPQVNSFADLLLALRNRAEAIGQCQLEMDLKPDFRDTPRNWEFMVESAFFWGER